MYNNPLLNQRNNVSPRPQQSPQMDQLRQMVQLYKNSKNPMLAMQNMLEQNKELKTVMNFVNKNGGNAQQLFYELAREAGADPQEVLKGLGI